MKKLIFTSLLPVFVLALAGCASEAPPTAEPETSPTAESPAVEPTEPANENTSREDGTDNQTETENEILITTIAIAEFGSLESFVDSIRRGTLPVAPDSRFEPFDLTANQGQILLPRQKREIHRFDRVFYFSEFGNYCVFYRLNGASDGLQIRGSVAFGHSQFESIHEYAQHTKRYAMVDYKIFEIIDDKYLLSKDADERWIALWWLDGDKLISFGIENDNWGRTVDRARFFEIFENFEFVDFATMEQELPALDG